MKTNYIKVAYCTILLFIVNITTFSQDNWSWLNPKPMGSSIESCGYFPGTNTIIAVGANGLIMRSTDNGTTWNHISSNLSTGFYSISTINSTTAFIAGEGPTILKTQDGGITWATVPTDTISRTISKIHFLDETTGYLKIENIVCFTSDGGINWTKLNFDALNGTLISMHAVSNTEVYVGKSSGEVIKCLGPYPGSSSVTGVCSTSVVSIKQFNSKLVAVGWDKEIRYSTDNGANWLNCSGTFTDLSFKDAAVIADNLIIAFTLTAQVVKSTDGVNWSAASSLPSDGLTSASGNFSGNGILLGGKGIQYSLEDGGSTWTKKSTSLGNQNLNIHSINSYSSTIRVGCTGTMYTTTNSGISWTENVSFGSYPITDIDFLSETTGYAVTFANLYKTADGGGTWLPKVSLGSTLEEVAFATPTRGYLCGRAASNYLRYTTNGGDSWIDPVQTPIAGNWYSISTTTDSLTAFACGRYGSNGRVLKIKVVDNVFSYTLQAPSITSGYFYSVHFISDQIGWAAGSGGNLYKTTNGGTNWSQQLTNTTVNLNSIRFADANYGIVVGDGGTILKTTDGGTTWTKSAQVTGNHLMSVTLIDGSTTLVAGYSGTVIKSYNAPLPVELTSFTASVRNNEVHLNWETATEIDNYGFDIERKENSTDWTKIGFIEGHTTSNSPKYYSFSDKPTGSSIYSYRLKQIDNDGKFEYSNEVEVLIDNLPNGYLLEQNYPNPFNPETSIKFVLKENTKATLKVYNALGELVTTLFDGIADAGRYYDIKFNGNNLSSGLYIYTLDADKYHQTRKMMLLK